MQVVMGNLLPSSKCHGVDKSIKTYIEYNTIHYQNMTFRNHQAMLQLKVTRGKYQTHFACCQVTHVTDLMFIMILGLFNNQIVSVAHSRVTFWLPPRCEPV